MQKFLLRSTMDTQLKSSRRWAFDFGAWSPSESEWRTVASAIQEQERTRIGKFIFKKDAKSAMAGRLMIRKYLTEVTGRSWKDIVVSRDANGKPFYGEENTTMGIEFNVSHNGGIAILAGEVRDGMKIGVDVMKSEYRGGKAVDEFFRIMRRQFSDDEWSTIRRPAKLEHQIVAFYRNWCLKESYVKALGVGITVDLKQISFDTASELNEGGTVTDTTLHLHSVEQKDWCFEESLIGSDHCAAVALYGLRPSPSKQFTMLSFPELIQTAEEISPVDPNYVRCFINKMDTPN